MDDVAELLCRKYQFVFHGMKRAHHKHLKMRKGQVLSNVEYHWTTVLYSEIKDQGMHVEIVMGSRDMPEPWHAVTDLLFDLEAFDLGLKDWSLNHESTAVDELEIYIETLRRVMKFVAIIGADGLQYIESLQVKPHG